MGELDGKVAIVTGSASGIGEAAARALAAQGARVVITGLHEAGAKTVADSIAETGAETMALGFDTSDEAAVEAAVAAVVARFGGVDILVNNAAITSVEFMMRDGMLHQLDVDLWDQTMAVNVRGYMLCAKHAVPSMLNRGGGVIVNMASGAGLQGEVVRAAYGTSKAAVVGFTRSVATQYGKMGIRSVTVVPGLVLTPTVASNMPPAMIEMMRRHHLTRDIPGPEDVANVIAFVASGRAAFITGATILVDGGFSAHGPSYADEVAMWAEMSRAQEAERRTAFASALAARGSATMNADDTALVAGLLADDVVWHGVEGASAEGIKGRDEVAARWNAFASTGERAVRVADGEPVYTDGTHVVGVLELANGGTAIRQANLFHLDADGKVSAIWGIPSEDAVAKALANGDSIPEHPNLVRFRTAEEARARNTFGADDLALIEGFLDENVHWNSPWGGGPASRAEVVAQFVMFNQATGGTLQMDLRETFADDTHAVSLVRLQADRPDRPGKHMDVREANVFHLDSEGHAYEFWGVAEDQSEINEFWS